MGVRELFELNGKVALITGGSRGLGLQIAAKVIAATPLGRIGDDTGQYIAVDGGASAT